MSHFSVLVATHSDADVDDMLAPYQECTENPDFLETVDITDNVRQRYEMVAPFIKTPEGEYLQPYDSRFERVDEAISPEYSQTSIVYPENAQEVEIASSQIMSFKEFVCEGYEVVVEHGEPSPEEDRWVRLDEDGDVLGVFCRANPNAKWDWYQVGGRFKNGLLIRQESVQKIIHLLVAVRKVTPVSDDDRVWLSRFMFSDPDRPIEADKPLLCDSAPFQDVDFENMRTVVQQREQARYQDIHASLGANWQTFAQLKAAHPDKTVDDCVELYRAQPGMVELQKRLEFLTDIDSYHLSQAEFDKKQAAWLPSFAGLTEDGWVEPAGMGWFGMTVDERPHDEYAKDVAAFWESIDPDDQVTIVDCHI